MKLLKTGNNVLSAIARPFIDNAAFLVFMYTLGIVCTYAVVPAKRGYMPYGSAFEELFFDLAIVTFLIGLLPHALCKWVKRIFYIIAYLLAVVDVFCFVKFDTTITPTMLLLIEETNAEEATGFIKAYLSPNLIFTRMGRVLLVMATHIAWVVILHNSREVIRSIQRHWWKINIIPYYVKRDHPVTGLLLLIAFVYCASTTLHNKVAMVRLMTYGSIGSVEHELTKKDKAELYQPVYRLVFSLYANYLTSKQVTTLIKNINKATVDTCAFRSENIVLIIGESYNRHHSSLYGYDKKTAPRQEKRARQGALVPFSDVVAPWNLTSFVFKHLFSMYCVGDKGAWCDFPLFPELFRKAGYHVMFLTNQFLPKVKEAVYDFSGGFFLNHPKLNEAQFDTRNTLLYRYDAGLINSYDKLKAENKKHNLIILHLKGQHVDYRTRYPKNRAFFTKDDYDRPGFSDKERRIMAEYDNAVLYNDSIVDQIIRRFENKEAVVIYVPAHGEECYESGVHFHGRMHSAEITARLAREEFDIPFWIWCSHSYVVHHPDVFSRIIKAKDKRYMTDALPHTLLWLGGIETHWYRDSLDILSPNYNDYRPRILKNTTDYDKLDWGKDHPQSAKNKLQ